MAASPYPATKFRVGRADRCALTRHGVLADIVAQGPVSLVVACAPAGYGKSTVLAQWAAHVGAETTWVSLEAEDDDPQGLWSAILAGFRRTAPDLLADIVAGDTGMVRSDVMVPLIDRLAAQGEPRILVLDDLHRLTREDTLASLDWFVRHLPPELTIAISSRTPVDLPALTRLRAHGEVAELTAAELRFDGTEVVDVAAERYDLTLSTAEAERLVRLTGGWPAAVSLVGAALRRGGSLDTLDLAPDSVGALVAEGLAGSSREAQALMLDVSVLEGFTEALVREVTASGDAWAVLMGDARRTGLVLALDDDRAWWRLHHLVREVLHDRLGREAPERRRMLHARAARAFEARDDITGIVRHLLGAENYLGVAAVLSDVRRNASVPRQAVGLAWLDQIPEAARAHDPRLSFWEAWATATSGDRDRRDRALARGRVAAGTQAVGQFPDWDAVEDFVLSSACYDDVGGALEASERFLARTDDPTNAHAVLVRSRRGAMLHLAGRNAEALAALTELTAEVVPLPRPLPLLVPAYQALASLEDGDHDRAARFVAACDRARIAHELGPDIVYLVASQPAARLLTETQSPEEGLTLASNALARALPHADAMLVVPHLLAEVARAQAALGRAHHAAVAVTQARQLIAGARDPGALLDRLDALADRPSRPGTVALSQRELEVLMLLPSAQTVPEIAAELFVSVNTARSHMKAIRRKLGVHSREEAVERARALGLLDRADAR